MRYCESRKNWKWSRQKDSPEPKSKLMHYLEEGLKRKEREKERKVEEPRKQKEKRKREGVK